MSKSSRQVILVPGIGVEHAFDLDKYILVPSQDIDEYVPARSRRYIRALASLYSTLDFEITNLALIVRKSPRKRFEPLSDSERDQVRCVVDALAYATHDRRGGYGPVRDNFEFTIWTFDLARPPTEMINLPNRRFGMRIVDRKDHMLQLPAHVHYQTVGDRAIDKPLLEALLRCAFDSGDESARVMRAISWLNQARTDADGVTEYTRFLLIATAFEGLLNTPDQNITAYFRNTIQFLLGASPELDRWAKTFYERRSKIVHGASLPELWYGEHQHNSILRLADIIFHQCVIRKLGLMGYWSDFEAEHIRRESVRKFLVSNKERFAAIQKFQLRAGYDESRQIRDYLFTIQRLDRSATEADCKKTLMALVNLALAGTGLLRRMKRFKAPKYREQCLVYQAMLVRLRDRLKEDEEVNVHDALRTIEPVPDDPWVDAGVRGHGFGRGRVINLDGLMFAMRQVSDHRFDARDR